jgi:hypothetical protein
MSQNSSAKETVRSRGRGTNFLFKLRLESVIYDATMDW